MRRSSGCWRSIRRPRDGASASLLARTCLTRATELGFGAVVICVRDFVAGARRLYARLGFVRIPERDWAPAAGVDLLALRLELAPSTAPTATA